MESLFLGCPPINLVTLTRAPRVLVTYFRKKEGVCVFVHRIDILYVFRISIIPFFTEY